MVAQLVQLRADMLRQIRSFFVDRNVLEVDTPHVSTATGTDPQVESLQLKNKQYLQTSPEFFMKRLLCAGSGDIYQLAHVFRNEEAGRNHTQEFMLLEWYRLGFEIQALMDEVYELVVQFLPAIPQQRLRYQEVFHAYLGEPDILAQDTQALQQLWQSHTKQNAPENMSQQDWLDLLMADVIEPQLQGAVFVYDYPVQMASLAKIKNGVAQRFELYVNGVELANGFDELQEAAEQRARFEAENNTRAAMGLQPATMDEAFLQALETQGLPQCAGVALGIDRLLMVATGETTIQKIQPF